MCSEIKRYFQKEIYGELPPLPERVVGEVVESDSVYAAGKATLQTIKICISYQGKQLEFPIRYCYPNNGKANKTVLLLNFRTGVPDKYLPAEEIIDNGWAVASLCYYEATADNADFDNGVAKALRGVGDSAPGKIMMWAWSAMRVMDYLQTLDTVDKRNVAIVGHSRLGKTALVTAALDERFAFVHSNDSGAGGAALFSMVNESAEHIEDLVSSFYYWFCPNFRKYVGKEKEMPFDQDELISLIAPRVVSIGSAEEDLWANPEAECKSTEKASKKWVELEKSAEKVGYYVRKGKHYLSREDWNRFLSFFDKHIQE